MEKTPRRLPVVERDAWLQPVEEHMNRRYEQYERQMARIESAAGSIVDYANGYRYFGWQCDEELDGWWFREWLPGAHDVYVFGDFNNWQRTEIRMHRDAAGVWSAFFPAAMYRDRLRARLALQDPRPRRQRLAGPHSGLRHARRTGRGDEELHRAVLDARGAVRLAGRRVRRLEDRQPADLRSPRGHGPGARGRGHLPRIHRKDTPGHQEGRLQRRAADGRGRAPLLRFVRLPRVELLRPVVALRHARGAERADPPRSRAGARGHHGPRARPLRQEPQRGDQRTRRHGPSLLAGGRGGLPALLGFETLRLRQGRGAPFPAVERQILARRVPFRRLPLRRRDLDDLPPPRLRRIRLARPLLRRGGQRGGPHLPHPGQPPRARLPSLGRDDRRGRERHAGHLHPDRRRRRRLRLPPGHGHSRLLDQTAQGGTRREVGHPGHVARPDRPPARQSRPSPTPSRTTRRWWATRRSRSG